MDDPRNAIGAAALLQQLVADDQAHGNGFWTMPFGEYLEKKLPGDASSYMTASQLLFDSLRRHGVSEVRAGGNLRSTRIFGPDATLSRLSVLHGLCGLELTETAIHHFVRKAAGGFQEARQALVLVGPQGSGKTEIARQLARSLMDVSITAIEGCPTHESPLHLLPERVREKFRAETGITVEGELCPICQALLVRQKGQYWEVPVTHLHMMSGIGISNFIPTNNPETDEHGLIGTVDFPGAIAGGHRGVLVLTDVTANIPGTVVKLLFECTADHQIPAITGIGSTHADMLIILITSPGELEKLIQTHGLNGLERRISVVQVPYNLRLREETGAILAALKCTNCQVKLPPLFVEMVALFLIFSRLENSPACTDLLERARIHNGEALIKNGEALSLSARDLLREVPTEGIRGIPPSVALSVIGDAINGDHPCLIPPLLFDLLKEAVKRLRDSADRKKIYEDRIALLRKWYAAELEKHILLASLYPHFQDRLETEVQGYLDDLVRFTFPEREKPPLNAKERADVEKRLKTVEEQIGVLGKAAEFRGRIIKQMFQDSRNAHSPGTSRQSAPPELIEAVQKLLFNRVRDASRIVAKRQTDATEDNVRERADIINGLVSLGYDESVAHELLAWAGKNVWVD